MDGWFTVVFSLVMMVYFIWVLSSFFSFQTLLSRALPLERPSAWPMVSVLVPLRNEEDQIGNLVRDLSAQTYPVDRHEILLIDDHSSSPVREIMGAIDQESSTIRIIELDSGASGKKAALSEGIRQAKGTWIITTDADTRRSPRWLETMIAYALNRDLSALAAPVMIRPIRSLTGHFEALEQAILTALSAIGVTSGTMPLCSGANLAFRKSFFGKVEGYRGNEEIASGDDVFLMQKFLDRDEKHCGYVLNSSAVVYTPSHQNIFDYIRQRARWSGKNQSVGNVRLILEGAIPYVANLTVLMGILACVINVMPLIVFLPALFLKVVLETAFSRTVLRSMGAAIPRIDQTLLKAVIYPLFSVVTGIGMIVYSIGSQQWKGRRIQSVN